MNTIRELKQQEKYKSMLKRKNKEKKIYKDKNASLQLEKQRLYIALRNKDKEIERLNNIINDLKLCNSDYYNQINTLSSKISLILERLEYEETNIESLKEDIIEIIFNKQITLGSDKE